MQCSRLQRSLWVMHMGSILLHVSRKHPHLLMDPLPILLQWPPQDQAVCGVQVTGLAKHTEGGNFLAEGVSVTYAVAGVLSQGMSGDIDILQAGTGKFGVSWSFVPCSEA